jgi:hypothetical protein
VVEEKNDLTPDSFPHGKGYQSADRKDFCARRRPCLGVLRTFRVKGINVGIMVRRLALIAILVGLVGCATAPPAPVVWYLVSPKPTTDFPHGDLYSAMWTWERVREFPTATDCQNALMTIHNEIHRPVDCIASNDRRMNPL